MRVILADDDRNVRSALRLLLEKEMDLDITAEVENVQGLLAQVETDQPDLVLMDWELPGLKAAQLISLLRECCPGAKLISLSGQPEARQAALQAGVDAFVSKGDPPEKLLTALQELLPH